MYAGLAQAFAPQPEPGALTQLVQGFLSTPRGRAVQQDVAGALAPFAQATGQRAATSWFQEHQTQLVIGGVAAVALIVFLARR